MNKLAVELRGTKMSRFAHWCDWLIITWIGVAIGFSFGFAIGILWVLLMETR